MLLFWFENRMSIWDKYEIWIIINLPDKLFSGGIQ